jgi:CRP/FNR family cyclic AMP-dependent transcriptional regulator
MKITRHEKLAILRTVGIFSETPEDVLEDVVSILEETPVESGRTLFRKGDIGNSMYIIYEGKIRIHDGDHTFAMLENKDIFGELTLFDPEPRSASATAIHDTILFKIEQDNFYKIMSNRIEVVRGILRILCQRLRMQNKHIINLKSQISWLFTKFHEIY